MNSAIKFSSVSFVGLGSFSPPQFSPAWLQSEGLFREEEIKESKIGIIAHELSEFFIPGIAFRVLQNSLTITADDQRYFESLKDLVFSIFSILDRTPIRYFGINYEYHFQVESEKKLDKLRDIIAPKKFWEQSLKSPILLRDITVQTENKFSPEEENYVRITVNRSDKIKYGVRVFVNNHFAISEETLFDGTNYLVELIKNNWPEIQKESKYILGTIMRQLT